MRCRLYSSYRRTAHRKMCDSPRSRVFSPLMRFYLKVAYSAKLFSYDMLSSYGNSMSDFILYGVTFRKKTKFCLHEKLPILMSWTQGLPVTVFYKRRSCHKKWQAQNIKYWGWMRIWTSEYFFRRRAAHRDMYDRLRSRVYPESNLSCWTVLRGSAGFFYFYCWKLSKNFFAEYLFSFSTK